MHSLAAVMSAPHSAHLAQVYDVSHDGWLGGQNGIRFITAGEHVGRALTVCADGDLKRFSKAGRALRHAKVVGKLVEPSAPGAPRNLLAIAAELRFQDAVVRRNDAVYRQLKEGDRFLIVTVGEPLKTAAKATKVPLPFSGGARSHHYPHHREGDKDGTVSSYMRKTRAAVFLTEQAFSDWAGAVAVQAAKAGMTGLEYERAESCVNDEVLRVAHALGPRAKPAPFDAEARQASVTSGTTVIRFIQDAADMMTVEVECDGIVVRERGGLVSVRMAHPVIGGIMPSDLSFNELGCAAYEEWLATRRASRA